jgi:hypothetical protein
MTIPGEIGLREARKEKIEAAVKEIEGRYEEVRQKEQEEYEKKIKEREEKEAARGKKLGGRPPRPPEEEVPGKKQYNFTDPQSRIMKGGRGQQFEQAYNVPAVCDGLAGWIRKPQVCSPAKLWVKAGMGVRP